MQGQINRGSPLGELIYKTVLQPDIGIVVEIGTWNGQGSTRCVLDALKERPSCRFVSVESSPKWHAEAMQSVGTVPNVMLVLGRVIEPCDIPSMTLRPEQQGWLKEDLDNYATVPNVLGSIPDKIDLLILDGGEFTSTMEFDVLSNRARYIILDDTNPATGTIKFPAVRERMLKGETPFNVIDDRVGDRNGWLFAKRRKT